MTPPQRQMNCSGTGGRHTRSPELAAPSRPPRALLQPAAVCLHPLPRRRRERQRDRPAAHGVTVTGSAAAREQRPSPAADGAKPPRVRDGDRRLADGGDPRLLQDARAIYQTNSRASIQTRCQLSAHEGASSPPRIARACRVRRLRRRTRSGPGCGLGPGCRGCHARKRGPAGR